MLKQAAASAYPLSGENGGLIWGGMCTVLAVACVAVWLLPVELQIGLRWQANSWQQQPWQIWTGSLAHLSDPHLFVNLLALLCLAIIGAHLGCGRDEVLAALIAWPLSNLGLLIWPQVQFYAGFSGLNHALAFVICAQSAMKFIVKREFSMIAFLLFWLLLVKIIFEAPWSEPLQADVSWGFTVVQAGHLTGMLAALTAAALVYSARFFRIDVENIKRG
jgi:rhomboid family GlyGly-CTERM serine protease